MFDTCFSFGDIFGFSIGLTVVVIRHPKTPRQANQNYKNGQTGRLLSESAVKVAFVSFPKGDVVIEV